MKKIFKRTFLVLALVTVTDFAGAQVSIKEASIEKANIYQALGYISDPNNAVTPDANGVIHFDITGDISEPESTSFDPDKDTNLFTLPSTIKKVVISSTSSTKHTVTTNVSYSSNIYGKYSVYLLHFAYKSGTLEVQNLSFANKLFAWMASTSSTDSDAKSTTYFHDCVFNKGYNIKAQLTEGHPEYQSDVFEFDNNVYQCEDDYIFQNSNGYKAGESFIFKNNEFYCFRGASLLPTKDIPINVTFEDNIYYHQKTFVTAGTSVTICQINGAINGNWTFKGNTALGLFTAKDKSENQKTCALMLQHGSQNYLGIVDGSTITVKDNILQCDVYAIGVKGGTGAGYDTKDITNEVLGKTYYNIQGDTEQTGDYTATISGNNFVHMYPKESATHSDDDACHVCTACGQMVIRAEVAGHGGTFQYLGFDGQMHDVNEAEVTIARNLYTEDIAEGVDLESKIVPNIKRNGFCLEPEATQDFVITPNTPNAFSTLTLYGRETPKDVTTSATTTDEGKTYHYTLTNDFTQLDPYTMCPKLVATINYGSIIIECEGLEGKESAVFEIKDNSGTVLNTVTLNAAHPKKVVAGFTAGTYKVAPQNIAGKNWQWTYDMDPSTEQTVTVVLNEDATAKFTVAKKTGTTVKNGENYKKNQLKAEAN